jgi:tetratricopeptide (TPR) repeat protein
LYEPIIEAESQQMNEETKARICNTVEGLLLRADWRERLIQARKELPVEGDGGPPIPLGEVLCDARGGLIFESISVIHRLARAGFLRSAMEEAYYALQFSPTYLPLHIYMGDLLLQQDRLPEAVAKFTVVAQTYNSRGESKRAIHMLRRVIHVAPMDLTARARLIELLSMHGNLSEAIQVYYNLADLARARQTYQEALRLAGKVKLEQSSYVYILHQMADIDLQSLDWREALRVYEQIRSLQPEDQRARENLIEIYLRLGQGANAEAELSDYLSYLEKSGLINQAEGFMRKLITENPDQPFMRRILAEILLKSGHRAEAVKELNSLGEYYVRSGDHPAAIEVLESLREIDPQNQQGYQNLLLRLRGA